MDPHRKGATMRQWLVHCTSKNGYAWATLLINAETEARMRELLGEYKARNHSLYKNYSIEERNLSTEGLEEVAYD
jgi:hypothetical protein